MTLPLPKAANYLLAAWPIIIIIPLIWVPLPSVVTGHPWRAELALSFYLVAAAFSLVIVARRYAQTFKDLTNPEKTVICIGLGFAMWGLLSSLWAPNITSPLHHTALWLSYIVFFGIASLTVRIPEIFESSLVTLLTICTIYSAIVALEYFFRGTIDQTFAFRYSRYAEISAVVLPLSLAKALYAEKRQAPYLIAVSVLIWFQILATLSRTSVVVSLIGIGIFTALRVFTFSAFPNWKRCFAIITLMLVVIGATQLPSILSAQNKDVISRMMISDKTDAPNSLTSNVRFLFYKVALAMSSSNRMLGVGADSYGIEFNKYRAIVSEDPSNKALALMGEDDIPERAHNEYLQVLSELGVVGSLLFAAMIAVMVIAAAYSAWKFSKTDGGPLIHAALAGMIVFLLSSLFSSFSFRLAQNGIVFFFLTAICLAPYAGIETLRTGRKLALIRFAAMVVGLCGLAFFGSKGVSQFLVYKAEHQTNADDSKALYKRAEWLDPGNAAANIELGNFHLFLGEYSAASEEFRKGIDKGCSPVSAYAYLISSQSLDKNYQAALETAKQAAHIFPYSVFARTRLGDLLQRSGDQSAADAEFLAATAIDPLQAVTWKTEIAKSPEEAAMDISLGIGVPSVDHIVPQNALHAITAEFRRRRIDAGQFNIDQDHK